jgi:hypothetical protein
MGESPIIGLSMRRQKLGSSGSDLKYCDGDILTIPITEGDDEA